MIFKLDLNNISYSDGISEGTITQSGIYKGEIVSAKLVEGKKTGNIGIELDFKEDKEGKRAIFSLYTHNKKLKPIKALAKLNALLALTQTPRALTPTLKTVHEYDTKSRKKVEVQRYFYEALEGKKIQAELNADKYYRPRKTPMMSYMLIHFFHYETGQTAEEWVDNLPSITLKPAKGKIE